MSLFGQRIPPAGYPRPTLLGKSRSRLANDARDGIDLDKYQPHLMLPYCVRFDVPSLALPAGV